MSRPISARCASTAPARSRTAAGPGALPPFTLTRMRPMFLPVPSSGNRIKPSTPLSPTWRRFGASRGVSGSAHLRALYPGR